MEGNPLGSKKLMNRVWLALFGMGVAVIGVQFLVQFTLETYAPSILEMEWYTWVLTAISFAGVGLPVFYLLLKGVPDSTRRPVNKLGILPFIVIFLICIAAMYISNLFGLLVNAILAFIKGAPIINPLEDVILSGNMVLTFLYGVIVAPIVEETIFRKILLNKVRRYGDLPAILVSGFAFGLFHMNLSQFFYATVLGAIFAYVTLKTNTIKYSILMHVLINFMGTTISPLLIKANSLYLMMLFGGFILTAVTSGVVLFIIYVRHVQLEKGEEIPERTSHIFLNPGMILFTLLCFIHMVLVVLQ
ncbi:MAG: putative rane protein [Herbinix sp.]|jgi:membrane protease YdiL (CAAX protease family)|nr:putative rane protein [Herbinix sp.]